MVDRTASSATENDESPPSSSRARVAQLSWLLGAPPGDDGAASIELRTAPGGETPQPLATQYDRYVSVGKSANPDTPRHL